MPGGFTLVEILVALVLLSVGLLGLLAFQAAALVHTRLSATQSTATVLVQDMAARIRANSAGARANGYALIRPPVAAEANCNQAFCTPTQMAAWDAWSWTAQVAGALPSGRGRVTCLDRGTADQDACSTGSPYRVVVIWVEADRRGDAPDRCPQLKAISDRCLMQMIPP
ncbi:MAG: type IV pilus modification protein PilV [Salinisphaera sp.]|nr:type IV pilus modification protein PilV [Salinisphaera sp.]